MPRGTNTVRMQRRTLVAAMLLGMTGCGGGGTGGTGGTGSPFAAPGTGGTGSVASYPIFSFGSISGFGSVIVNQVRFDDSSASIRLDGQSATSAQLGLGMTISVSGEAAGPDATSALASSLESWSIAQGAVTARTASSVTVAGMMITVNAATVYGGAVAWPAIAVGDMVKVWGVPSGAGYTSWTATRIEPAAGAARLISSGVVKQVSGQLALNGYSLAGAISTLATGQVVTVSGNLAGGTLTVAGIHLLDALPVIAVGTLMEREGAITAVTSATQFLLGNYGVDASDALITPAGTHPVVGARVEVYGTWNGNTIVARKLEYQTLSQLQEVELEAAITQFNSVADFVVRDLHCDASGLSSVGNGRLSDLRVGLRVHLQGINTGGTVRVTKLEISG
ncbi:hypothetical protein BH11PSE7_BH11PSE7_07760 [soil metagenome]